MKKSKIEEILLWKDSAFYCGKKSSDDYYEDYFIEKFNINIRLLQISSETMRKAYLPGEFFLDNLAIGCVKISHMNQYGENTPCCIYEIFNTEEDPFCITVQKHLNGEFCNQDMLIVQSIANPRLIGYVYGNGIHKSSIVEQKSDSEIYGMIDKE